MTILGAIPVVECQTIELTLDFYLQLFQFVVINKRESKGCLQWVYLKHGNSTLMLKSIESDHSRQESSTQKHSRQKPSLHSGLSLYLYVNDINKLHHFIKAKNRSIADIALMDYQMLEFKLPDPEGNMITVGQSVSQPINE